MALTTIQPINLPNPAVSSQPVRNPSLRAQWQVIDGKLVCQWFARPD